MNGERKTNYFMKLSRFGKQFEKKDFPQNKLNRAINQIVYGSFLAKYDRNGKNCHSAFFYLHEKDISTFQWISTQKEYYQSRLDLSKVIIISANPTYQNLKKNQISSKKYNCNPFKKKNRGTDIKYFLSIISEDKSELVLRFDYLEDRDLYWQGLQEMVEISKQKKDYGNPIINMANRYFVQADLDGNQQLSKSEIRQLLKLMQVSVTEQYFDEYFDNFDKDKNGYIDQQEFQIMTLHLMSKSELLEIFKKYSKMEDKEIQKKQLLPDPQPRRQSLFQRLSRDFSPFKRFKKNQNIEVQDEKYFANQNQASEEVITLKNLQKFFLLEQEEQIELDQLEVILQQYECDQEKDSSTTVGASFFTFVNILFSDHNTILDESKCVLDESLMRHPITDFYIFSSHNTYLMANQLTGISSIQAYRNAFNYGCKCVEIDCWVYIAKIHIQDGDSEPQVTHGHTLTSKILFKDVIAAIKQFGFLKSAYPVIISLELHCSTPFQKKIANILNEILEDQLFIIPDDWNLLENLPSPEELRYKVIVKGKGKLNMLLQRNNNKPVFKKQKTICKVFQVDDDSDSSRNNQLFRQKDIQIENNSQRNIQEEPRNEEYYSPYLSQAYINVFNYDSFSEILDVKANIYDEIDEILSENRKGSIIDNYLNDLRSIINNSSTALDQNGLIVNENKQIPEESKNEDKKNKLKIKVDLQLFSCYGLLSRKFSLSFGHSIWEMCSIDEKKVLKLLSKFPVKLIQYHQKYLSRIYPKGARISSSNYSTLPGFVSGAQMTALNVQTYDDWMLIYKSNFLENGQCGYILKPDSLRKENNNKESQKMLEQVIQLNIQRERKKSSYKIKRSREQSIVPSVKTGNSKIMDGFGNVIYPKELVEINFISGQQLAAEVKVQQQVSPYLRIELKGLPVDEETNPIIQSEPVKDNGQKIELSKISFNPIFNHLTSFTIYQPWFATLVVKVLAKVNSNVLKLAQAAIPIRLIRNGYRILKLENDRGKLIHGGYLFLQVKKKELNFP